MAQVVPVHQAPPVRVVMPRPRQVVQAAPAVRAAALQARLELALAVLQAEQAATAAWLRTRRVPVAVVAALHMVVRPTAVPQQAMVALAARAVMAPLAEAEVPEELSLQGWAMVVLEMVLPVAQGAPTAWTQARSTCPIP